MDFLEKFINLMSAFEKKAIRVLVIGGIAAIYYGVPRTTMDLDIAIAPDLKNLNEVIQILKQENFSYLLEIVSLDDIYRRSHQQFEGVYGMSIDLWLRPEGFNFEEAWDTKMNLTYHGCVIHFISKEYLIKMKKIMMRDRDIFDLKFLHDPETSY